MASDWALVFYTSLVALGTGIFIAVGVNEWRVSTSKIRFLGALLAFALLALGGFSSVLQLGHPERIFGALSNPTSGIFMESMMMGLTALSMVAYMVALRRRARAVSLKIIATIGGIFAAILAYAVGDTYTQTAMPAWNTLLVPLVSLMTAITAACFADTLLNPTQPNNGRHISKQMTLAALIVFAAVVIAYVARLASSVMPDDSHLAIEVLYGELSPLFWIGIVAIGWLIPTLLTLMRSPKTSHQTLASVALMCVFVGAISFRLMMFRLGTAM